MSDYGGRPSAWQRITNAFRLRSSIQKRIAAAIIIVTVPVFLSACWYPTSARAYAQTYYSSKNPKYFNWQTFGGDCTDFVSQALRYGNAQFTTLPGPPTVSTTDIWFGMKDRTITTETALYLYAEATAADRNNWQGVTGRYPDGPPTALGNGYPAYNESANWFREQTFIKYMINHGRAVTEGSYSYQTYPAVQAPATPSGMFVGDVFAYNLTSSSRSLTATDHVTLQVAGGPTNPKSTYTGYGYSGTLVSSDDAPLYGAFWSLKVQQTRATGNFHTMTIWFINFRETP